MDSGTHESEHYGSSKPSSAPGYDGDTLFLLTQVHCPFNRSEAVSVLLCRPGINDLDAAILEVDHVAGGEGRPSRTSHGDNHGVELADRLARQSARGSDLGIYVCGIAVETQYLTREIFRKNLLRGIPQSSPTLSIGEQSNAMENLAPSYGGREQGCARLARQLIQDGGFRYGSQ